MSNLNVQLSVLLPFPKDKIEKVRKILDRENEAMKEDPDDPYDGFSGYYSIEDESAVWFRSDEDCDPEQLEIIARAIIEELEIDTPFYCSWAYTCNKPRPDAFGGGAFVIKRGYETIWCDAREHVHKAYEKGFLQPLNSNKN